MDGFVRRGKASVIIDGQFGSTGKGLIAAYVGQTEKIDIATTNASANAGHTAVINGRKLVAYHLPMSGIFDRSAVLYLNAGAIIDPAVLERELQQFEDWDARNRLIIHPRAAVIELIDVETESDPESSATKIASTQHGVGAALCRKIQRGAVLAGAHPVLSKYVIKGLDLNHELASGARVVLEVPQGFGLGINSGFAYPHCTSREVSVQQGLSDAAIHPEFLGQVLMTLRTFPIRVGDLGMWSSGPWYPDQTEVTWERLGVTPEITTVTKRIRRVATFSAQQYAAACQAIRPTHIFLNFVNYLRNFEQFRMLWRVMSAVELDLGLLPPRRYFGVGPETKDIFGVEDMQALRFSLGWSE